MREYYANKIEENAIHDICLHIKTVSEELSNVKVFAMETILGFRINLPEKYRPFYFSKNDKIKIKSILVEKDGDGIIKDSLNVILENQEGELIAMHDYGFYHLIELSNLLDNLKYDCMKSFVDEKKVENNMQEKENKELGESYDISVDSDINLEKTKTIDGLDVFVVKWTKGNHKFNGKDLPLYKIFEDEMLAEDLVRSLKGLIQLKNKFVSTDGQDNKK